MLDEVTPQLLVNVVDEMLLVQRGRELGYKMGDEQFKSIAREHQEGQQDRNRRSSSRRRSSRKT